MDMTNVEKVRTLLKGIETGDPEAVNVISPDTYIQHNPQTHEGREGLAALFARLSQTNPRVNIVRAFEDGNYVFAHTEYDFATCRIGFEVFRFEDGFAVEHWDNIQPRRGPNPSGHSMIDGPTEASDFELTETNRDFVRAFVEKVLIPDQPDKIKEFVDATHFTQHNPHLEDGSVIPDGRQADYRRLHRILAQGDFVLTVCEGSFESVHSSFYDLFRVSNGMIVEHWDTIEAVPPQNEWKNDNGKF